LTPIAVSAPHPDLKRDFLSGGFQYFGKDPAGGFLILGQNPVEKIIGLVG
jgi:hypothetical protein